MLTAPLTKCLRAWAAKFPTRDHAEFVFQHERYRAAGDDFVPRTVNFQRLKNLNLINKNAAKIIKQYSRLWKYEDELTYKMKFYDSNFTFYYSTKSIDCNNGIIFLKEKWSEFLSIIKLFIDKN